MRQILTMALTLLMAVAMQGRTSIPAIFQRTPDVVITSSDRAGIHAATGFTKEGATLSFAQGSGSQTPGPGDCTKEIHSLSPVPIQLSVLTGEHMKIS